MVMSSMSPPLKIALVWATLLAGYAGVTTVGDIQDGRARIANSRAKVAERNCRAALDLINEDYHIHTCAGFVVGFNQPGPSDYGQWVAFSDHVTQKLLRHCRGIGGSPHECDTGHIDGKIITGGRASPSFLQTMPAE